MKGGQVLSEHPLPPGAELVVGRSEGCDVTIADGSVSRLHARLVADGEGVYVEDLGSANGTFVDGTRVRGRARLDSGQEVRVAQRAQAAPFVLRVEDERQPQVDESTKTGQLRERWARFAAAGDGDQDEELPPPVPIAPAPDQPLWRMGGAEPTPLVTVRVADADRPSPPVQRGAANDATAPPAASAARPRTPTAGPASSVGASPLTPASAKRPRTVWLWGLVALALLFIFGLVSLVAWRVFRLLPRDPEARPSLSMTAPPASKLSSPAAAATTEGAALAATPAPSPAAEVLVVPTEAATTTVTGVGTEAASSPAAATGRPLAGKWAARLENVFYPEDDYVIELRLDLQQRGTDVSGSGRINIEGKAMTFGVPATTVSGTVRRGPPPWPVSLRLPFGRPIGELQLEGTLDGDALAGTFRSSAAKQPGAWHAVRAQP